MNRIKSVVLNKNESERGYIVEFYNPFWGRFAIECVYDKENPGFNNMIKLMRVGDYFLVHAKSLTKDSEIKEYEIVKYMSKETEEARRANKEMIIPNMNVHQMDVLADNILKQLQEIKTRVK